MSRTARKANLSETKAGTSLTSERMTERGWIGDLIATGLGGKPAQEDARSPRITTAHACQE
jgi:hypothetical protein